ncbi:MAG TPA: ABC transporter permease [Armatimonadota bacterium]|mgnify:CR=1 FL=1|nr:ABC transporter permease [Armatimonadota bacterium]
MNLLLGSLTIGLILSITAFGVYIAFRVFSVTDITTDGSLTLGASVCAVLLVAGIDPVAATLLGGAAGFAAGLITGILHTRLKINAVLAGILVMTALYSVNLHVMGRSNVPLLDVPSLYGKAEAMGLKVTGNRAAVNLAGWDVPTKDVAMLILMFAVVCVVALVLYLFFRTNLGTAMRATGDNPQMIRALGADTRNLITIGLGLSNCLVALSGALLAQYQGFADVQMGIGMIVWGLASVVIGEALVRTRKLGLVIAGTVLGSVLFRLLVAIALRFGLNPNDLKLVTAVFVLFALVIPGLMDGRRKKEVASANA